MDSRTERFTVEQLISILEKERPYLIKIEEKVEKFKNGVITFHIRKQNGKYKDLVTVYTERDVLE